MNSLMLNLSAAYFLDLIFGDPQWFPHPVRAIGFMIDRGEKVMRKICRSEVVGGALLSIGVILLTFYAVRSLLLSLGHYSFILFRTVEIFLLYSCLSTKDLAVESREVQDALQSGNLAAARQKLSRIVGRDTGNLDEKEIVRGAVETVAENAVDGIIAPLFYALIGGAPLAMAYKAVNTLDSMIGHRNEKYIRFGRFAAAIDRWANWIPARISGFLFPAAAAMTGFSVIKAYRTAWECGALAGASNSAVPEGAMAGALGVQLGGINFYQGQPVETPRMGYPERTLSIETISEAIRMMYAASVLFAAAGVGFRFFLEQAMRIK